MGVNKKISDMKNTFCQGVVLGSFIFGGIGNIKADPHNPLFQHEYGHYIDSRRYGLSYLLAIGIPSIVSAWNSQSINVPPFRTHGSSWTEVRANKNAKKYFGRYYGVDWDSPYVPYWWLPNTTIEDYYPTSK